MDVVELTQSEWASLVLFIAKEKCTLRVFIDYRKLNAVMILDSYPTLYMNGCTDLLSESTISSVLDGNSGYCWVKIANDDRKEQNTVYV